MQGGWTHSHATSVRIPGEAFSLAASTSPRVRRRLRVPPEGTIPMDQPIAARRPVDVVARGEHQFQIFCAVCHGVDGSGYSVMTANMPGAPPLSLLMESATQYWIQNCSICCRTARIGCRRSTGQCLQPIARRWLRSFACCNRRARAHCSRCSAFRFWWRAVRRGSRRAPSRTGQCGSPTVKRFAPCRAGRMWMPIERSHDSECPCADDAAGIESCSHERRTETNGGAFPGTRSPDARVCAVLGLFVVRTVFHRLDC